MKKYLFQSFHIAILIIVLGALSEPLIAIAYSYLGNLFNEISIINFQDSMIPCVLLTIIGIGIGAISGIMKVKLSNKITNNLKKEIYESLLKESVMQYRKHSAGEYINRITKKCDIWQKNYYNNYVDGIQNILQIVVMACILTMIHKRLFVLIFIFLLPLFINNVLFPKKLQIEYTKYLQADGKFITFIKDCLTGFETIKVNIGERYFHSKASKLLDDLKYKKDKTDGLGEVSAFIANAGVTLSQFAGTCFGVYLMMNGEINFSEFMIVFQLSTRLYEPFVGFINNVIGMKAISSINEELEEALQKDQSSYSFFEDIESISLKNACFKYHERSILHNVNFTFTKGSYLIIGESGSGKTTLIDLLLKHLPLTEGDILYNERSINALNHDDIYHKVAYMSQDSYIFHMSIKDNIDIRNEKSEDEIEGFIIENGMEKIIQNRVHGVLDILDQENKISGGERSRMVYLRTILSSSKDVIIFDEVLSNLDKENSMLIEHAMLTIRNKIVIHIAHHTNMELYTKYDNIIELKEGRFHILRENGRDRCV